MTDQIKITFLIEVDGYVARQNGDVSIHRDSWDKLKQHHPAIGEDYINCNPSGGDPDVGLAILTSKGVRFTEKT